MSKLPMDINFGKAESSAAQRSARESLAESQSHLSGYNHSVNSAFNQANQFSQQYGNSSTMSSGADNAQSMSDTIAANKMVSAAKTYAQKNNMSFADAWSEMDNNTRQLQANAGIRGSVGFDSNRQFAGKLAGFATGASIKGDFHAGVEVTAASGSQDSMSKSGTSRCKHWAQKSPLTVTGSAGFLTSGLAYSARSDAGLLGSAAGLAASVASVAFGAFNCGIAGGGVSCRMPAV